MFNFLLLFFRKSFITNLQLKLEVIFLTKQLEIYQRTDPKLKIKGTDRIFLSILKDLLFNWKEKIFIVKPETVIKWHRTAFRFYWKWKSQLKKGRPKVSREVIALIKRIAYDNPAMGCTKDSWKTNKTWI
jgi:hypothetical protein